MNYWPLLLLVACLYSCNNCCTDKCGPHGYCLEDKTCHCADGYAGAQCQVRVCEQNNVGWLYIETDHPTRLLYVFIDSVYKETLFTTYDYGPYIDSLTTGNHLITVLRDEGHLQTSIQLEKQFTIRACDTTSITIEP